MSERGSYDYMWGGLNEGFRTALEAFVQASNGRLTLISGYRDEEHQQALYDAAVAEHGEANAGKWAAPPGRSNHNHGFAGDLRFVGEGAKDWAHENAARFGLHFPMSWEPWHIEPIGLRDGTIDYQPHPDSYTMPPRGARHPLELTQGQAMGGDINRLLRGPMPVASAIDVDSMMEGPAASMTDLDAGMQVVQPETAVQPDDHGGHDHGA